MSDILQDNKDIFRSILKVDNIKKEIEALDRKPPYNVHKGESPFSVQWMYKLHIGGGGEAITFDEDEVKEAIRSVLTKRLLKAEEILNEDVLLTERVRKAMLERFKS